MNETDYEEFTAVMFILIWLEIGVLLLVAGMWMDVVYPVHYATPEEIAAATDLGAPIPLNGFLKIMGFVAIIVWIGFIISHLFGLPRD
jgi:hypothetical protein